MDTTKRFAALISIGNTHCIPIHTKSMKENKRMRYTNAEKEREREMENRKQNI